MTREERFRAFVAVEVGARPGAVALLDRLAREARGVKLVSPENLHVTLRFLGDLPAHRVADVRAAVADATAGVRPFALRLCGVGTFPARAAPRVLWIGLEGADPLVEVARRLTEGLRSRAISLPDDRPFAPHLTLARAREGSEGPRALRAFAESHRDAEADEIRVEDVRLMRSDLSPAGPAYAVVERIPLEA